MLAETVIAGLARQVAGLLAGGTLRVSDGDQADAVAFDAPVTRDGRVTVTATFDVDQANFEWLHRELLDRDGNLVDAVDAVDLGRKAPGSVWTIDHIIDLNPKEGTAA